MPQPGPAPAPHRFYYLHNFQRALDGLMEFLPSKSWFEHKDVLDTDNVLDTDLSYPD